MSYGIEVKNKYGSIIINETSQTYIPTSTTYGTASPGATYPPTGITLTSDYLVFGAPAVSQNKIAGVNIGTPLVWNNSSEAPTSYRWIAFKRSDLVTAGTGYGFQVFDSAGDVCYDSTTGASFKILQAFKMGGRIANLTLPSQTTTYSNFQDVFVLMNTMPISGSVFFNNFKATWTWTTSTTGRIAFNGGNLIGGSSMVIQVLK